MLPDRRILQAPVREFWGGSCTHNTLGSFVCLRKALVSERRGGSESETCTDGWPPCMRFCHLLASCCPAFTCFPVFLWGREGVLLSWQGLKFALLLQTRPHPVLIQDLLAYTSEPQQNNAATAFHFTITHIWSVCSCSLQVLHPLMFLFPLFEKGFSYCSLKVILQEGHPVMSVSTSLISDRSETVCLAENNSSSADKLQAAWQEASCNPCQPQRACRGMWVTQLDMHRDSVWNNIHMQIHCHSYYQSWLK